MTFSPHKLSCHGSLSPFLPCNTYNDFLPASINQDAAGGVVWEKVKKKYSHPNNTDLGVPRVAIHGIGQLVQSTQITEVHSFYLMWSSSRYALDLAALDLKESALCHCHMIGDDK